MTSNKLFLFAPASRWTYCGGATLICERSLDDAVAYGNEHIEDIAEGGAFVIADNKGDQRQWVFQEVFILVEPREVGIVFSDANYA